MIRVGVVGCGAIAQLVHLPLLKESHRAELVGVNDLNPKQAEVVARKFDVPKVFQHWEDMIGDDSLGAIFVCSSSHSHPSIAIAAMERGKHVLVEKPMALGLNEAEAMAETAGRSDRVLVVGYMWRYDPGFEKAIELLRSGRIGEPFLAAVESKEGGDVWAAGRLGDVVRAEGSPALEQPEWTGFDPSPEDHQHFSVLADIGSHLINLLVESVGGPRSIAFADAFKESKKPEEWSSMTFVSALRYENLRGTFTSSLFMGDVFDKHIRVLGSKGWLEVALSPSLKMDSPSRITTFDLKTGSVETHSVRPASTFLREHEHFFDCIEKGANPWTGARDGLEEVRVREAMMRSYKENREIEL